MLARHGGATEARQAGVALADIAEHVQHADLNTTRKHYIARHGKSLEADLRETLDRLARRKSRLLTRAPRLDAGSWRSLALVPIWTKPSIFCALGQFVQC
jgi:integrase